MRGIFDQDGDGFDREEFLLKTFLGLLLSQYIILAGQLGVCSWYGVFSMRVRNLDPVHIDKNSATRVMCDSMVVRLKETFDLSVTTILALLGGAGIGSSMQQRRSRRTLPPVISTIESPPPDKSDEGPAGGGIRMR